MSDPEGYVEGRRKLGSKKGGRDVSPTAFSQSSAGLEWDPSADVGSSTKLHEDTLEERGPLSQSEGEHEGLDPSASSGSESRYYSGVSLKSRNESEERASGSLDVELGTEKSKSSISNWLDVGMTRSEIEYQKKRSKGAPENQADSDGSVMWVEVQATLHESNGGLLRSKRNSQQEISKSVGHQLNEEGVKKVKESWRYRNENVYHSTPTDRFMSSVSKEKETEAVPSRRRRDISPPQPFNVASRKPSHHHHHAHHSRTVDHEFVPPKETRTKRDEKSSTTSSSDLSPPCYLIDKLAKDAQSPVKKRDMMSAIEMHRDYHVKKVKHELKQLEKLNQLLSVNLAGQRKQSSDTSGQEVSESVYKERNRIKKSPQKRESIQKRTDPNPPTSDYSSTSNTPVHSSNTGIVSEICRFNSMKSKRDHEKLIRKNEKLSKKNKENEPQPVQLERKLDKLIDTFGLIADLLKDKENKENVIPVLKSHKINKRKPRPDTQKKNEPVKPPVAYFLPYSSLNIESLVMGGDTQKQADKKTAAKANADKVETQILLKQRNPITAKQSNEDENSDEDDVQDEGFNLQNAFEQRHPYLMSRLHEREAVIARLKAEREIRTEKKREWIRKYGENPMNDFTGLDKLPPKGPRLMTTKEMRKLTERNYKRLPEVREKILQRKAAEEKKTNRIMSQVFAHKLRENVLKGEMNIMHSQSLIRR